MIDEFARKLRMYSGVHTLLREPANEALWLDQPPYLTQRVADFETGATDLGAFGNAQSGTLTGITQQQNLAETALEAAAHPLGRALRLYYRQHEQLAEAAVWDLTITEWTQLAENVLLSKATALHTAAQEALTETTPPLAPHFGVTTARVGAFLDLVDDYGDVIGAPVAARSGRKAKTTALRPRFRVLDGILADMDDLILSLRGLSAAHDLFVDAYFNARRIGGPSEDTTPAPPNP